MWPVRKLFHHAQSTQSLLSLSDRRMSQVVGQQVRREALGEQEVDQKAREQEQSIKRAIEHGFEKYRMYRDAQIDARDPFCKNVVKVQSMADESHRLCDRFDMDDLFAVIGKVERFYANVHKSGDEEQVLFFEFLVGLHVVLPLVHAISNEVGQRIDGDLIDENIYAKWQLFLKDPVETKSMWKRLERQTRAFFLMQNALFFKEENIFAIWQAIENCFLGDRRLKEAMSWLCSLRYLPANREVLGKMQTLHWKGFGGNGEWLASYDKLKPFLPLCIGYQVNAGEHFSTASSAMIKKLFIPLIQAVKSHGDLCVERYIDARKAVEGAAFSDWAIFDAGCGAKSIFGRGWENYLPIREIALTDVSYDNLQILRAKEEELRAQGTSLRVFYQDLCSPSSFPEIEGGHYDLFVTSLVLHQCTDGRLGMGMIVDVMRYINHQLQEGALWLWIDTAEGVYLQGPVIPGNLVDREGKIPNDIYRHIDLEAVSHMKNGEERVEVLCHFSPWRKRFPENLKEGIYGCWTFFKLSIPQATFDRWVAFQRSGEFSALSRGMEEAILERYPALRGEPVLMSGNTELPKGPKEEAGSHKRNLSWPRV